MKDNDALYDIKLSQRWEKENNHPRRSYRV